jgi:hypothetical protein
MPDYLLQGLQNGAGSPLLRRPLSSGGPPQWTPESEQTPHPLGDAILGGSNFLLGAAGLGPDSQATRAGNLAGAGLPFMGSMKGLSGLLQSRMGLGVEEGIQATPKAAFLGWQDDAQGGRFPLYNIEGGERHGSTVSDKTLAELGIPIPKVPGWTPQTQQAISDSHMANDVENLGSPYQHLQPKSPPPGSATSVNDMVKGGDIMDRMHAEANPVFKKMEATGMFSRVKPSIANQAQPEHAAWLQDIRAKIPSLDELYRQLPHLGKPAMPYENVVRMPKVGGVLDDVLSRAAGKSGVGMENTPGEARLLEHYSKLMRPGAEPSLEVVPPEAAVPQMKPGAGDIDSILEGLKGTLKNIPSHVRR